MEIVTDVILFKDFENIVYKQAHTNEINYVMHRQALEFQKFRIICTLKQMKDKGEIKSIFRPKNKKIQDKLDELVEAKRILTKSIDKIREVFYKVNS